MGRPAKIHLLDSLDATVCQRRVVESPLEHTLNPRTTAVRSNTDWHASYAPKGRAMCCECERVAKNRVVRP